MALDDESVQVPYTPSSYFERRREGILGPRLRKRKHTEFAKDETRARARSRELRAQLRAASRLAGVLDAVRPGRDQVVALLAQAIAGPKANFEPRPRQNSLRIYEYCAYVRCLITAEGLAATFKFSMKRARNAIRDLAAEGLLRPQRRLLPRSSPWTTAWEWVGP